MLTSLFTLHTFFACLECRCRRCPDLIWRIWCCVCTHIDNWQRCMKRICNKDEFFKRSVNVFVKAKSCSYLVEGRYSSRSKYVNCDPFPAAFYVFNIRLWMERLKERRSIWPSSLWHLSASHVLSSFQSTTKIVPFSTKRKIAYHKSGPFRGALCRVNASILANCQHFISRGHVILEMVDEGLMENSMQCCYWNSILSSLQLTRMQNWRARVVRW